MRVALESLSAVTNLAAGGQTKAIKIVTTDTGCTHLFKCYNDSTRTSLQPEILRNVAGWRAHQSPTDRAWLDEHGAWIRHVVDHNDEIVGVLIPIAPQQFWVLRGDKPIPREGARLLGKMANEEHFNLPHRLHLLGVLLNEILWFHERDIVIGDIQLANILIGGSTDVFLIDLDSAWVHGRSAFPLTENPRYAAPITYSIPTCETDLYKFALVAIKVLSLDGSARGLDKCANSMASFQQEILASLLACHQIERSTLIKLAQMWIGCLGISNDYIFSSNATTRLISSETPCQLRPGVPPAIDNCSARISYQMSSSQSQATSNALTPVPPNALTPIRRSLKRLVCYILLLCFGVISLSLVVYFVFFIA